MSDSSSVTLNMLINATPSVQTKRTKALEFAMGLLDANSVDAALASAEDILAFLDECSGDFDLRVRALAAASSIVIRSGDDSCVNLVLHAREFLAFLNSATSSATPDLCAAAGYRSGAE